MNWFEKIVQSTNNEDQSPELKRGEIKQILIQEVSEVLPDFEFMVYKNGCYTFQRIRQVNSFKVYEILNVIFSLKEKNFACSIASRLNQDYIFSNQYNNGFLNPHIDLKVLRHNSGALNIEDAYYFHNGQVETTTKIVKEIVGDFKKYGLSFLDKQNEKLKSNGIVNLGFEYIDNLKVEKERLKKEITEELNQGRLLLSSIKHPIFIELKGKLKSDKCNERGSLQMIPKTAHEFLELYWSR